LSAAPYCASKGRPRLELIIHEEPRGTPKRTGDDFERVPLNDDAPATVSAKPSGDMCMDGSVPTCRGNASARNRHLPG